MILDIELIYEQESNRWLACIDALPGVMAYGNTQQEAIRNTKPIAMQTLTWMLEDGELSDLDLVEFKILSAQAA